MRDSFSAMFRCLVERKMHGYEITFGMLIRGEKTRQCVTNRITFAVCTGGWDADEIGSISFAPPRFFKIVNYT